MIGANVTKCAGNHVVWCLVNQPGSGLPLIESRIRAVGHNTAQ